MAGVIGEEEIGDDDVFSVEEPANAGTQIGAAGTQIGAHLIAEAKEKNKKYLLIKVGGIFLLSIEVKNFHSNQSFL